MRSENEAGAQEREAKAVMIGYYWWRQDKIENTVLVPG
jgi:hypothetical protein